jgi:phage shock protein A
MFPPAPELKAARRRVETDGAEIRAHKERMENTAEYLSSQVHKNHISAAVAALLRGNPR